MKKLLFLLFLGVITLTSCQSQNQGSSADNEVVLSVEEYQKKLASSGENVQLLDVRTPKEYEEGHIDGAVNINYFDENFLEQVQERFDKGEPVLLYCRSGNRSGKATAVMKEAGFGEIYDLEGGFTNWPKK